jgi:hypothetical protein
MAFSNKPAPKPVIRVLPSSGNSNYVNTEAIYYMQNNMIGRLMNSKKCTACPKH